ncbi:NTF2-related export protein 2 [Parasteatoda tepidariorum]|uniref:NTF2-related export protein 2 n=1 Tax=Parasteatoda tepidariorum TaxID=114398 RepID=UPI00077F95AB|nr:NTF2-related export protein 2 [Parasteatoda tepidariorum]
MSSDTKRSKVELAGQAGDTFSKLFYETLDKKRHAVSNLYMDLATLVWNGNPHCTKEAIGKFYESLPVSRTEIKCVDAQPVFEEVVQQTTVLVTVSGNITFTGRTSKLFTESIMLTTQSGPNGNVWKIVSDNFRFHDTVM